MLSSSRLSPIFATTFACLLLAGVRAEGQPTTVATGAAHSCVVTAAGGVRCWGGNDYGQLGDGTTVARTTPVDVVGLGAGVASLTAGAFHTCALTTGGAVKCWGSNAFGQLGDGTTTDRLVPADVVGLAGGVSNIGAGYRHTCAVTNAGAAKCWGDNSAIQLGYGGWDQIVPTPVQVLGLANGVASIAGGRLHTCVTTTAGGAKCWGMNSSGALGVNPVVKSWSDTPVDVTGLASGVARVTAGWTHTCALTTSGGVKCWGENIVGQLGDGTTTDRWSPADATGLATGIRAVAAGDHHTCAITITGAVKCWGWNNGALGNGTSEERDTPVDVVGLPEAVAVVAPGRFHDAPALGSHTCAVTEGGRFLCWGENHAGQLGDGTTTRRLTPRYVVGSAAVVALSGDLSFGAQPVGTSATRTLTISNPGVATLSVAGLTCPMGFAAAWSGNIPAGGSQAVSVTFTPPAVTRYAGLITVNVGTLTPGSNSIAVSGTVPGTGTLAGGGSHTCALSHGAVRCWGANADGQLGDGTTTSRTLPTIVPGLASGVAAVAAGGRHSCALTVSGAVKCWGSNAHGQLGDGTTTGRLQPVDVSGLSGGVVALTLGEYHSCAVMESGGMKCWGDNTYGQLGDATLVARLTPVDVFSLEGWVTTAAAGAYHTCAVTASGAAWCWGDNSSKQVGYAPGGQVAPTPTEVTGQTSGAVAVACGAAHSCVVTTAGGVRCWGANTFGQLGNGSTTTSALPVDVGRLAVPARALAVSGEHTCVATASGGVKCWGANFRGQLGDGTTTFRTTPSDVTGLAGGLLLVSGGAAHSCGATSGGRVSCWGWNAGGQLGDGTVDDRVTPVRVAGLGPAADFDGDSEADAAVYRPASGTWFWLKSSVNNADYGYRGWGVQAQGDTPVVGDFDGDGVLDPTVFRPASGTWFVLESRASFTTWNWFGWGNATDTLMPGDYDGDGKTDAAVYRASTGTWYVRPSSGATAWNVVFGQAGDVPMAGDFDGDGIRDIAVYRPASGTWFWLKSSSNFTEYDYRGWGVLAQNDRPAPGDYDGDGKTDLCVFRPATGTWFILESHAGWTTWNWFGWGNSTDTLAPADYDGDGTTDAAIYRASTGEWFVRPSSGATPWNVVFGQAGDLPLTASR